MCSQPSGGNVGEQLIGRSFGLGPKLGDGVGEVDGVPEDDGGDREVETGGTGNAGFSKVRSRISP